MRGRRFFFYGTLMDPLVRRVVLGRSVDRSRLQRAVLPGFRRVFRRAATYPVLVSDAGGRVDGIVASGLSPLDVARLVRYEGAGYRLSKRAVQLAGGQTTLACIFLPDTDGMASSVPWQFVGWRRRFRGRFLQGICRHRTADTADRQTFRATAAAGP